MARYDAILSLTPTTTVDGCVGTATGALIKALRSGDQQRPALHLVLTLQRQYDYDRLELPLARFLSSCRSDSDGPLARSGR